MTRTANSPQSVWQQQFLTCSVDERTNKQRQGLDHPANWWYNPTNPRSLRLTRQGYNLVKNMELKNWQFDLDASLVSKNFLQMEKHFNSPYYINGKKIIVWGEVEAMMLALHGNNLAQYLDNLSL